MTTARAIWIPEDGRGPVQEITIDLADGGLKALQEWVGGFAEALPFPGREDVVGFVAEGGRNDGFPLNNRATNLMRPVMLTGDWIAGELVLIGENPATGSVVDLPDDVTVRLVVATIAVLS